MADKILVKLNVAEIGAWLKSPEMMDMLRAQASEVQARAGEGYELSEYPEGRYRANVSVYAATKEAIQDNYDNNTLLKALGG